MGLINNSIESLYNGVSQQAAEHRQPTQVSEMINAYPTIDIGLVKRNPTFKTELTQGVTYTNDMWTYEYDRGLSGSSEEKYAVNVLNGSMEIINVSTGKVYKEYNGLTYEGTAKNYLTPFSTSGYSGVTIKDTTFILNKNIVPKINELVTSNTGSTSTVTAYKTTINFANPTRKWNSVSPYANYDAYPNWNQNVFAPTKLSAAWQGTSMGSTTTVSVDGIIINYSIPRDTAIAYGNAIDTWVEYKANLYSKISGALPTSLYSVTSSSAGISIERLDGTPPSIGFNISFLPLKDEAGNDYASNYPVIDSVTSDYYSGLTTTTSSKTYTITPVDYRKDGYLWINSANPANPYTYSVTASDNASHTVVATVTTETTSNGAASAIATAINANANFSAVANGSVVRITATNSTIKSVDSYDSFGNQATFAWSNEVTSHTELPANLGFEATVRVVGNADNGFDDYWLKCIDGVWKETLDPTVKPLIDAQYMPHVLVRNANDTFTLKQYDKWKDRVVGDDESNPYPSFIASEDNGSPKIKDIFFFKNRLGFITERTVAMSEVGEYGNFWRTTVATLLDSDPIDTAVDTTKAIQLEYATYLEDSVMLFSDKAQFKLSGGSIVSPSSVQITQTSSYEINKAIRPLYMNDKIFFCTIRGNYSAIMQYQIKSTNTSSEAIDITAHVQSYIPKSVTKLTGSSTNNMLFLTDFNSDTVYCYKYYESGMDTIQSAWFKWQFNGNIHNAFSLGNKLNLMINRNSSIEVEESVLSTGVWNSDNLWKSESLWISKPDDLISVDQFEYMNIAPNLYSDNGFADLSGTDNETPIQTDVNFGEWVATFGGKKDIRGTLKFKTVQISSELGSEFQLYIKDIARGDTRLIESKYTVNRKPMVYGDAKNMEIGIKSNSNVGFRINTISYEGNFNSRSKKV